MGTLKRILFVDDESNVLDGLRVLLRKQEKTAALCNDTLVTCIGWQARLKTVLGTLERKP